MVAGEVLAETGHLKLAMDFIGDTGIRVMQRYQKKRPDPLREVAAQLDTPETVTEPESERGGAVGAGGRR